MITATFYPGVKKEDLQHGTMAEISWQRLEPYLSKAFGIREKEILVGITVTELGVKGKIEYTEGTQGLRGIPKK